MVLQHDLSYGSINETVLRAAGIAVPMLTSSGGEDGCPQVPGVTPIQAVGLCGCAGAGGAGFAGLSPPGRDVPSMCALFRRTGRQF